MNILLLGATGFLGNEVLRVAMSKKHHVKVLVRNPQKIKCKSNLLEIIEGDYLNAVDLESAMDNVEVVITAIGLPKGRNFQYLPYVQAMETLIRRMEAKKIKRLIYVGGAASKVDESEPFNLKQKILKLIVDLMGRHMVKVKLEEYALILKSNLDWTIVRPPQIVMTRQDRNLYVDDVVLYRNKVNLYRLANFVVDQIESRKWIRKSPLVSSN